MSNTITAFFKGRIGVAESVYQHDYGRVLVLDKLNLGNNFDAYFEILGEEEAVPQIGQIDRIAIPNSCLANPGKVTLHIPVHSGQNDSEVEYIVTFAVIGRAKPVDDGTPAEQTAVSQAIALLRQPIDNIEQIVNEALDFTGDTFDEMREQLADDFADYKDEFRTEIAADFDSLNEQFQTAVSAVTVDSEVQNVRVGDDNHTYTSAGDAVRKQLSDVKGGVQDVIDAALDTSEEYIYSTGYETGSIEADGTINSGYDTYKALSYTVEPDKLYRFRGQFLWSMVGIAFYDSNDDFIQYRERKNPPISTDTNFDSIYRTPKNCTKVKVSKLGEYQASVQKIIYANAADDDIAEIKGLIGNQTLKPNASTLINGINDTWNSIKYPTDEFAINDYLQTLFALFRWNDTYGYAANQTAMSIIAPQKFPFDVKITNLHFPDFMGAIVRTFSSIIASPSNLVDTISYTMYGDDAVDSIVLPKDTYWTIQFTRPNNVNIELATYKVIPHFIAGDNIKFSNQLKVNNTLVVGKAFAPYTKIQDAVDAASSGDTILILPGTYEEDVSVWGKEVHLLGLDRDSTIILERSGLYSKPPLEINVGSVRNLTLLETGENSSWGDDDGKGRAYAVHIENGDGYTGVGELWFENCKLINYAHAAVGCGLYQDLHVHFNNCYMYSGRADDVDADRYRGTFYYHTCVAENITGQMMTVKDCEIINEDTKCFFGGVTPNATSANMRSTFIHNNFYALAALSQNTNDLAVVYNILNFHDCKLTGNSTGNNIPALNAF